MVGSMYNLFANAQDVALESLNKRRRNTDVMSDKIAAQLRTDLTLDDSASLKMAQAKLFASNLQTHYSQLSVVTNDVMYAVSLLALAPGIPGQPEGKRFHIQYIGLHLLGGTRS